MSIGESEAVRAWRKGVDREHRDIVVNIRIPIWRINKSPNDFAIDGESHIGISIEREGCMEQDAIDIQSGSRESHGRSRGYIGVGSVSRLHEECGVMPGAVAHFAGI